MLPLIDLHRHLEGSIRSSTFLDIAPATATRSPRHRPRDELVASGPPGGLLPYLAKVDDRIGVIAALGDWRRVAREAVEDAFNDGLDYVEFRFSPYFIQQQTGLAPEAVIDAVAEGAAARLGGDRPAGRPDRHDPARPRPGGGRRAGRTRS